MLHFKDNGTMPEEYPDTGMPEMEFEGLLHSRAGADVVDWDETDLVIDGDEGRVMALLGEMAEGKHGEEMQMIAKSYDLAE